MKEKKIGKGKRSGSTPPNPDSLVLAYLSSWSGKYFNDKQIMAAPALRGVYERKAIQDSLERLLHQQKIEQDDRMKYRFKPSSDRLMGILRIAKEGYGFVQVEGYAEDFFVPERAIADAFPGDTVEIRVKPAGRGRRSEAEVMEVISRARTEFIATLRVFGHQLKAWVDETGFRQEFEVMPKPGVMGQDKDKVQIRFIHWNHELPLAELVQVLGKAGEHNTEMHAILLQYGFEEKFPEDVQQEADAIPKKITASEIKQRRDFRNILTFTIDPVDAKDFDDAISYEPLENGNLSVGVHIADVTHYLKPGTALDKEAKSRATSVYLVDRTVPMLPEILSNDLCSLRPKEDRLTFSAVFEFTPQGKVVDQWFGKGIIHSDRRFAYEEVQFILDAESGEYSEELIHLNKIAHILRKQRFAGGSISFETDEVRFKLDPNGKPLSVELKIRKDAHKLIEDFMLLANKSVATWAHGLRKKTPPAFVYRIHDLPNSEKLENLQTFVKQFGYDLDVDDPQKAVKSLNDLMQAVEGKPEQNVVQSIAIRSMAKAIYTTKNVGHYGLGFKFYTHFTSPIRRYPDVMVHRLLEQYLDNRLDASVESMETDCKHCSDMEKKATEAERASIKYKQAEYLEDQIGKAFDGIITGVTNWGLFVELNENKCEGLLRLSELKDDHYEFDEKNYRVVGSRNRKIYRLGDPLRVVVKQTDLFKRTIDFRLPTLNDE